MARSDVHRFLSTRSEFHRDCRDRVVAIRSHALTVRTASLIHPILGLRLANDRLWPYQSPTEWNDRSIDAGLYADAPVGTINICDLRRVYFPRYSLRFQLGRTLSFDL